MSFETSWGVAPPTLPTPDKTAKRKRPSTDPAKIDGATINLEKLMGLMDKEASQPKTPSGKDLKKAASGKKDKPVEAAPGAGAGGGGGPAAKKQRQDTRPPPKSAQATTPQEPKAPRTDGKAEKGKGRGKNKAAKKANAIAAAAAGGETPALPPHLDMEVDTPVAPVPASATIALKPLADDASAADTLSSSAPVETKKSKKAQKKERLAAAAASSSKLTASAPSPVAASKKLDASSSKNTVVMHDDEPSTSAAPAAPADSNLTPMQLKMKRKLEGSRFRYVPSTSCNFPSVRRLTGTSLLFRQVYQRAAVHDLFGGSPRHDEEGPFRLCRRAYPVKLLPSPLATPHRSSTNH